MSLKNRVNETEDNNQFTANEVVISGFSGRLPESSTIEEFKYNLFNGIDMVNDDPKRWPNGLYNLPARHGKIKDDDLETFDIEFFGMNQRHVECMDPQLRMLLELTYEAIVDAGINPQKLRGSRTGVYVGVTDSEIMKYWLTDADRVNGYSATGCYRAMFANRVSFAFDFKGPSCALDTACSSSFCAMARAFDDLKAGYCDAAVVAGTSLILNPTMTLQYKRLGNLYFISDSSSCSTFFFLFSIL